MFANAKARGNDMGEFERWNAGDRTRVIQEAQLSPRIYRRSRGNYRRLKKRAGLEWAIFRLVGLPSPCLLLHSDLVHRT